jgi:hypothetical protein
VELFAAGEDTLFKECAISRAFNSLSGPTIRVTAYICRALKGYETFSEIKIVFKK